MGVENKPGASGLDRCVDRERLREGEVWRETQDVCPGRFHLEKHVSCPSAGLVVSSWSTKGRSLGRRLSGGREMALKGMRALKGEGREGPDAALRSAAVLRSGEGEANRGGREGAAGKVGGTPGVRAVTETKRSVLRSRARPR